MILDEQQEKKVKGYLLKRLTEKGVSKADFMGYVLLCEGWHMQPLGKEYCCFYQLHKNGKLIDRIQLHLSI